MEISQNCVTILNELRVNARESFSLIGRRHGIPATTVFECYSRLTWNGFIIKHAEIVDFSALGFPLRHFIFIRRSGTAPLPENIANSFFVNSISRVSGLDFMIDLVTPGLLELYSFLESLEDAGASEVEVHDVFEHVKVEGFSVRLLS